MDLPIGPGRENPVGGQGRHRHVSENAESQVKMAGEPGFEPRLTESESAVLPLNYSPSAPGKSARGGLVQIAKTATMRKLKKERARGLSMKIAQSL
jgi:hypothetical protein